LKRFEALDIETYVENNLVKPLAVAITNNDEVHYFLSIDEKSSDLINFIKINCKSSKIYYVHNLTFEAFVLADVLKKNFVDYSIFSTNGIVYSMVLHFFEKNIVLKCSYRLTMLSLKDFGKLIHKKKGIFPFKILKKPLPKIIKLKAEDFINNDEYNLFLKQRGLVVNVHDQLKSYCIQDVLITKQGVLKFLEILKNYFPEIKMIPLTASSLAIKIFFKKAGLLKKRIKKSDDLLIRQSYYGGRCEVFGNLRHNETALHFDFKGMYAQCMLEKIPCGELKCSEFFKDFNVPGFYLIDFFQNMQIPVLPYKHNDGLFFLNGVQRGWYWFEEINLFLEMGGTIIKVNQAVYFDFYEQELSNFVNSNNEIRGLGEIENLIGKNNNNTFYGRLGMNPLCTHDIISGFPPNNGEEFKKINGSFVIQKKSERSVANVSVAAAITSKARIKLYKGMESVQNEGGRLLYCDTDSIVVAFEKTLINSKLDKKIGEIYFDSRRADTVVIDAVFALPKTYAVILQNKTEIIKVKGFNNNNIRFLKFKWLFNNSIHFSMPSHSFLKSEFSLYSINSLKQTDLTALRKRIWNYDKTSTSPKNIVDLSNL